MATEHPATPRYPWTPYRVEHRPTREPHTREELVRILDQLAGAGVKAWWYSVSAKGSYPLFPSRHLPFRESAVDYYPWLTSEAHRRGITIFSWEYLTTAPLLAAAHPEWCWRFFDWSGPRIERDGHYVCRNSPYGELLKDFCVEVINDLGFDGIWFDGSFMHGHGASGVFACCCGFCAARYLAQTGNRLPETIDMRDARVREYLEWRYRDHTEYWRSLSAHVREKAPRGVIVFNYFNRFGPGISSGSPMRRMAADAPQWPGGGAPGPMEGMVAAEVGAYPQQTMILAKILRAVNDNYPVELWAYGGDFLSAATPDPDPGPMLFHAYQCAASGGFASFGVGRPSGLERLFPLLTAKLSPLADFIPGKPAPAAGLVVSGCTKDYAAVDDAHPQGRQGPSWNAVIGMHNLLNALRLQTEVLLDNMLADSFLHGFPAVILPEVICMSRESGEALRRYVKNGGTLLAVGETATRDELGRAREKGLLDDLFGVSRPGGDQPAAELLFSPEIRGRYNEASGEFQGGLPPHYRLPGRMPAVHAETADILAETAAGPGETGFAAITRRRFGQGLAILVGPNIAGESGRAGPGLYSRNLVDRLLVHIRRPFTAEAPPSVVINLFRQEMREVVHILNFPPGLLVLGIDDRHEWPSPQSPRDFVPTGPVTVEVPGNAKRAHSPTRTPFNLENDGCSSRVTVPRLERYAMIVLEK